MLDPGKRRAIPMLKKLGYGERRIAKMLQVSRTAVRKALAEGGEVAPRPQRETTVTTHRDRIVEEIAACGGNISKVQEELAGESIEVGYSTLARFVRENGLARQPKPPAGRYHFEPGQEMQFDTSPHKVTVANKRPTLQCASIVLCYSRVVFFQYYRRFTRFEARVFLGEAMQYLGGSCGVCMIDNTNVVILHGTGEDAVPCPEMKALADRFGFSFRAHAVGDANRSGRVERPFQYIENNFLRKRRAEDLADLNGQARAWCDKVNAKYRKHLKAKPIELLVAERPAMSPLPAYVPEVYQLFQRTVDLEGYIHLHTNSYTVPYRLIGQRLEVRESIDCVTVYYKHDEVAVHDRVEPGLHLRRTIKDHRPERGTLARKSRRPAIPEEQTLRADSDHLDTFVTGLKGRSVGRAIARIRKLHKMRQDYPRPAFLRAVEEAVKYGMYDLHRLEKMILRNIAGDYFKLADDHTNTTENDDE